MSKFAIVIADMLELRQPTFLGVIAVSDFSCLIYESIKTQILDSRRAIVSFALNTDLTWVHRKPEWQCEVQFAGDIKINVNTIAKWCYNIADFE